MNSASEFSSTGNIASLILSANASSSASLSSFASAAEIELMKLGRQLRDEGARDDDDDGRELLLRLLLLLFEWFKKIDSQVKSDCCSSSDKNGFLTTYLLVKTRRISSKNSIDST